MEPRREVRVRRWRGNGRNDTLGRSGARPGPPDSHRGATRLPHEIAREGPQTAISGVRAICAGLPNQDSGRSVIRLALRVDCRLDSGPRVESKTNDLPGGRRRIFRSSLDRGESVGAHGECGTFRKKSRAAHGGILGGIRGVGQWQRIPSPRVVRAFDVRFVEPGAK